VNEPPSAELSEQAEADWVKLAKFSPLDRVFEASAMMDEARRRMGWLAHYRALAVAELRAAGIRVDRIAEQLRVSRQTVHRLLREAQGDAPPSVQDALEQAGDVPTEVPPPRCPLCGVAITVVQDEYTAERMVGEGNLKMRVEPQPTGYAILQPCRHRVLQSELASPPRGFRLNEGRLNVDRL
jgi:hypothetical protein